MSEYTGYPGTSGSSSVVQTTDSLRRSVHVNRYSRKAAINPNTRSWVQSTYDNPPGPPLPPPPQSLGLPSPVSELHPLPNPYARNVNHARSPLHVVNTTPSPDEEAEEYMDVDPDVPGLEIGYRNGSPIDLTADKRPLKKKKSFVGKVFRGVGRLPSVMFGYGAGIGKKKSKWHGTSESEFTSFSAGTGNTLPRYTSNPATPDAAPLPPSNLHYGQTMDMAIPEAPEESDDILPDSPPPNVVRLSDNMMSQAQVLRRSHLLRRVAPPSELEESTATEDVGGGLVYPVHAQGQSRFVEPPMSESSGSGSGSNNPIDRTTVMLYDHDRYSRYPENIANPIPPLPVAREISNPRLSHASSDLQPPPPLPLQPLRPTSLVASMAHGPAPADLPPRTVTPAPGSHVTYAPQAVPARATYQTPLPAPVSSTAPAQAPTPRVPTPAPPPPAPAAAAVIPPSPEPVQSPVSLHPRPSADYLKMTLSPPPTSHDTATSGTSFSYEPSFSSELSPVERFFKALYHMPWVSHDRVTVDYRPGEGVGNHVGGRKRRVKPLASWYRSMLAGARRRSRSSGSATLDLLSSGHGHGVDVVDATHPASPRASLAGLALALGSPFSGSIRHKRSEHRRHKTVGGAQPRKRHHRSSAEREKYPRSHHHGSGNHHNHGEHQHRRHDKRDSSADSATHGSPVVPAMYPYMYPSYPYAGYPSPFPLPPPAIPTLPLGQTFPPTPPSSADARNASPAPPGSRAQAPVVYQAMLAPPQMYVLQPTTALQPHTANGKIIPPALVPGSDDKEHGRGTLSQSPSQKQQYGQAHAQAIPGASS